MPENILDFITTKEEFCPYPTDDVRWWAVEDWDQARVLHSGMWPGKDYWSQEEWRDLYSQGYRYCSLVREGHALAMAGLWPRVESEWMVIAVGTAPGHRNRGYAKAVVSFVTEEILCHGVPATISTKEDNVPMLRVIECLGFARKK